MGHPDHAQFRHIDRRDSRGGDGASPRTGWAAVGWNLLQVDLVGRYRDDVWQHRCLAAPLCSSARQGDPIGPSPIRPREPALSSREWRGPLLGARAWRGRPLARSGWGMGRWGSGQRLGAEPRSGCAARDCQAGGCRSPRVRPTALEVGGPSASPTGGKHPAAIGHANHGGGSGAPVGAEYKTDGHRVVPLLYRRTLPSPSLPDTTRAGTPTLRPPPRSHSCTRASAGVLSRTPAPVSPSPPVHRLVDGGAVEGASASRQLRF